MTQIASFNGYSASETTNKFFYGIGATTEIGETTSAYASILYSNIKADWQVGVNRTLNKSTVLNVNYRYYAEDYFTLKGLGVGIAYKF
jgi:hypothetical protein